MGATTPPDRRRSLFLFFFLSFLSRASPSHARHAPTFAQFPSLYTRVFEFSLRIDSLSSSLLDNRDNKARLIGSYNRTDRCSLSRFIHLRTRRESFHPCHGEIRAYKLRSKNKDNRKRTELFSLDPRDSNGKSSGIPNTIRSDGVSLISAISA